MKEKTLIFTQNISRNKHFRQLFKRRETQLIFKTANLFHVTTHTHTVCTCVRLHLQPIYKYNFDRWNVQTCRIWGKLMVKLTIACFYDFFLTSVTFEKNTGVKTSNFFQL